jgi:hypothetical protein
LLLDVSLDFDLVGSRRLWPVVDGRLDPLGDETLADAADRGQAGAQRGDNFFVGHFLPRRIGKEEDAGMRELACSRFVNVHQPFQAGALVGGQSNFVLGHGGTSFASSVRSTLQRASSAPLINRRQLNY